MAARGRPTGSATKAWEDAVRKASHAIDPKAKMRKLEQLANSLISAGLAGDVSALKEIGDRLDGKVPQAMEHAGKGGGPLVVTWQPPSE